MIATRLAWQMPAALPMRMRTMAAAILAAPRTIRLEMVPLPSVAAGQARVRVAGCVVSPGHREAWQGGRQGGYPLPPGEPGAEAWGVVEAVGQGVHHLREGDDVVMVTRGGFAEYAVADADAILPLAKAIGGAEATGDDEPAVAGLSLGRAMNVWRRAGAPHGGPHSHGGTIAVIGMGFVGLAVTQLASAAGLEVVAISRRERGLRWARACGAARSIHLTNLAEAEEAAMAASGGRGFPRVVETSGAGGPTRLAGRIASSGGRIVIAGGSRALGGLEFDGGGRELWRRADVELVSGRTRDVSGAMRGLREAIVAVEDGRLTLQRFASRRFDLPRLGEAMSTGGGSQRRYIRTWVGM